MEGCKPRNTWPLQSGLHFIQECGWHRYIDNAAVITLAGGDLGLENVEIDLCHCHPEAVQCILRLPQFAFEERHRPHGAIKHPQDEGTVGNGSIAFLECDDEALEAVEERSDEIAVLWWSL